MLNDAGNPDLMNIDHLAEFTIIQEKPTFLGENPLVCACASIDPLPQTLCVVVKTNSYYSFDTKNVCLPHLDPEITLQCVKQCSENADLECQNTIFPRDKQLCSVCLYTVCMMIPLADGNVRAFYGLHHGPMHNAVPRSPAVLYVDSPVHVPSDPDR